MRNHLRQLFNKITGFLLICLDNYILPPENIAFRNQNKEDK